MKRQSSNALLRLACLMAVIKAPRVNSGSSFSVGSNVKVVVGVFEISSLRENMRSSVVEAVETVWTPEAFQGPVEIIKKKPPKATDYLISIRPGSFHSPHRPLKMKRAPVVAGALN